MSGGGASCALLWQRRCSSMLRANPVTICASSGVPAMQEDITVSAERALIEKARRVRSLGHDA